MSTANRCAIFADMVTALSALLKRHQHEYHQVIAFDPNKEAIAPVDLRRGGDLPEDIADDTETFCRFMEDLRIKREAAFLIGGYNELRHMYSRSTLFTERDEPRRLHLGTDIWGPEGTPVHAFLGGMVHSIGYNEGLGNYGATIVLLHQLEALPFYTLYGHVSISDIQQLTAGQYINRGQVVAHFGNPAENGEWPPHLHFQIIEDIGMHVGDYPGVCRYSDREAWLLNCPDPDLVLQMNRLLVFGQAKP
ncbi:peptidoglycan DD-metalloendopeptidase family protein [Flavihumibacter sp.]|uniref:peptidoglycan DD-metalloendopeptidase family protein n=1 Tax=Flavihumibacter sp. TaxID=1913981 RepID=UPI002FC8D191|nr:peptidoglycan DD-metalloendopeptidase family protein [Flavihumibacter sediminis]